MGQSVLINSTVDLGEILVIDTDRSLTGQDGQVITPAEAGSAVPGLLAERLFGLDIGIDHVHVLQNIISVRLPGGWDEDTAGQATEVAESFLLFYGEEE